MDEQTPYYIRSLNAADAMQYKRMRLEALTEEQAMFASSYEREAAFEDSTWIHRLGNPDCGYFGLYYNNELIGITCVMRDKKKPELAHMMQSYIRKVYRGKKLSRILYNARIAWAKGHSIKRLAIAFRTCNESSKAAASAYGFKFTHCEPRDWLDGGIDEVLCYEMELD